MNCILGFLAILVFHGAHAQLECIPERVANVSIDLNYQLRWIPSLNCRITQYEIFIFLQDDVHYMFQTEEPYLDVAFLPACERFSFSVRAFSDHMLSDASTLEVYMPAPSAMNITISELNVTRQGRGLFLNWEVEDHFAHCARAFRVVIREGIYIRDVYTQNKTFAIENLIPCAEYELTVTAIYNQQEEGPIKLVEYLAPPEITIAPILLELHAATTYFNATFGLERYALNNCPITALRISGTYFSRTYEIQDSFIRPEVTVEISPLQADTMYYVGVFVVNNAGSSEPLAIGIQTLPLV